MAKKFVRRGRKAPARGYKKRGFNGGTIQAMKTSIAPDRLIVKLPYTTSKQFITEIAGVSVDNQFRLNSIYDPDFDLGGTHPLGYSEWNSFYNRYRVIGAHVTARFCNRSTNSAVVALIPSNQIADLTDPSTLAQIRCYWNVLGGNQANCTRSVTKYFSLNNIVGRTKQQYMDDNDYAAPFNANPSELINLHIVVKPDYGDATVNMICELKIMYVVELYDRDQMALAYVPADNGKRTEGDGTTAPNSGGVSDIVNPPS